MNTTIASPNTATVSPNTTYEYWWPNQAHCPCCPNYNKCPTCGKGGYVQPLPWIVYNDNNLPGPGPTCGGAH